MQNPLKKLNNTLFKTSFLKYLFGVFFVIIFIVSGLFFYRNGFLDSSPRNTYEVAVIMRDQTNSNSEEDARNSLKKGDVLIVQGSGHGWSKTEVISYLILKMKLTDEQVIKLTKPKIEVINGKDEILFARKYFVNLDKRKFKDIQANNLISAQPFSDTIFDWRIIDKK